MDADDFEELAPASKTYKPVSGPVMLGVTALRNGSLRLSFSLEEELGKRIGGAGWPRFSVSFSKGARTFRIAGKVQGPFEAFTTQRGNRVVFRVPAPSGVELREWEKVEPSFEESDGILYVRLPAVLERVKAPEPLAASVAAEARQQSVAITAARKAVPAPDFSARKRA